MRNGRRAATGRTDFRRALSPQEAAELQSRVLREVRARGLDPFPTIFEFVDLDEMNELFATGGFPNRYPHWRFGMAFEEARRGSTYGLHRIYELVINHNPCYAYLLRSNSVMEQKVVMAHVYGHADFFRHNLWFAPTNRRMLDEMADHGSRIYGYMQRYGVDVVEDFLDAALSAENLLDIHAMYSARVRREQPDRVRRLPVPRDYMDRFINPPEYLERERRRIETRRMQRRRVPPEPERDVLGFLMHHAPLEDWERDILGILREEALYFAPQQMTRIMNEGWASYWHSKLMTEDLLSPEEWVDYADLHASVLGGDGPLNPYKLGLELWRWIERIWPGRPEKLFEARRVHSDVTFVDEFLTAEFCRHHSLFTYRYNPQRGAWEVSSRDPEAVRQMMLQQLTNLGHPRVAVVDADFRSSGQLLLRHEHDGRDLDIEEAKDALKALGRIWRRPVHLETQVEGQGRRISWDGSELRETALPEKE